MLNNFDIIKETKGEPIMANKKQLTIIDASAKGDIDYYVE